MSLYKRRLYCVRTRDFISWGRQVGNQQDIPNERIISHSGLAKRVCVKKKKCRCRSNFNLNIVNQQCRLYLIASTSLPNPNYIRVYSQSIVQDLIKGICGQLKSPQDQWARRLLRTSISEPLFQLRFESKITLRQLTLLDNRMIKKVIILF